MNATTEAATTAAASVRLDTGVKAVVLTTPQNAGSR